MTGTAVRPVRRWPKRIAVGILGLATVGGLAALVCKAAVGWVYPVTSGSMEPTIMTGESVFLRYSRRVPDRFDIVAFTDTGGGASIKRAYALPNDRFLINASGDVRINGRMLLDEPNRPPLVPVFDSSLQSIEAHWRFGSTGFNPWSRVAGAVPETWALDASAVDRGAAAGLMRLHDRVTDGRLDENGEYDRGPHVVHDVAVEFEVRVLRAGGVLRVQLTEQGDVFEALVPIYDGKPFSNVYLTRQSRDRTRIDGPPSPLGPGDLLAGGLTSLAPGSWFTVRFENIDNRLTFLAGGDRTSIEYDRNTELVDPVTGLAQSLGERVRLGANGLALEVRNVRVLRDVHVVPRGEYGVGREIQLGSDEIFVLGDSPAGSRDSRDRGPIPVERLIGRAEAVVKPLGRFRRLR